MSDELYRRAGVEDLSEFYRTKFVSDEVLDARYFRALDRFDMRFARTMWVYDNVRAGSTVLDLGCGAGMLALLKRKNVTLTGVDLSEECALASRRNGYDLTCAAELTHLPFNDNSFDYVVSLDVLGHVEFKDKDAVLTEVARVLRPEGVTLHGIECTDRRAQKSYEEMSEEELRRFVSVDGHVGLEEEQEHAARFERFFAHIAWEPRYALCLSSEEFVKQREEYGLPFETDFVEYLRGLSHSERRAFDMAMGYVFNKISDLHVRLPKSGLYVLLKASQTPLGPFYNEHRERAGLLNDSVNKAFSVEPTRAHCLDRAADFDDGWYEPNMLPPVARWMKARGRVSFRAHALKALRLDITSHMPDLPTRPLGLELFLNGRSFGALSLLRHGWLELIFEVPDELSSVTDFELELRADRTWQPRPGDAENRDDRELSIAVCNLEALTEAGNN
ncbi:MAG: methyltransferase domain-containing protein [Pyrinomonadaceae bacterium]